MAKLSRNVQEGHYYSHQDGEAVFKVAKVTNEYVLFHEVRLTLSVIGAPTVVSPDEFAVMVDHEVEPQWVRK